MMSKSPTCRLAWLSLLVSSSVWAGETLVDAVPAKETTLPDLGSAAKAGVAVGDDDDTKNKNDDNNDDDASTSMLALVHRQIEWVRSKEDGFVHEYFAIRPYNAHDPNSALGVFAAAPLPKDTLLFRVPRECLIATFDDDMCDTVEALATEMQLGNASEYEPFVTYLKRQAYGQLPTMWSDSGKDLLMTVLDQGRLPPEDATHVEWGCHDATAPLLQQQASMLLVQRGWDEIMIPIYDLLGHRNGWYWLNTKMMPGTSVHDQRSPIEVYTARDIAEGEELYGSYSHCNDCGGRAHSYGTAEIMRDYGFVEAYPQKWIFGPQGVSFTIDYTYHYNEQGQVVSYETDYDHLQLHWHSKALTARSGKRLEFFQQQIKRLTQLEQSTLLPATRKALDIPQQEWDLIVEYHQALLVALKKLIENALQRTFPPQPNDRLEPKQNALSAASAKDNETLMWLGQNSRNLNHGQRQMDWVRSKGGFVSGKIEIRKMDPTNPQSYGVFATQDIKPSEMILSIPRACLVYTLNDNSCETVDLLAREFRLGNQSRFEPYVTYLLEVQPYAQLPSLWSPAGRRHLLNIILESKVDEGDDLEDLDSLPRQVLPPRQLVDPDWIGCRSFDDQTPILDRHAAMLVHQRGWDEVMIPVFDMFNHRNGEAYLNTRESHSVHDWERNVEIEATREIKAGDQLYTTYDSCFDCGGRTNRFGTAEMFRDYGFVELMEQKWIFPMAENIKLVFTLNYKYNDYDESVSGAPGVDDLVLTWITDDRPDEDDKEFFEDQIERLLALKESDLMEPDKEVPAHEWEQIVAYHGALLTALQMLVQWMEEMDGGSCAGGDQDSSCVIPDSRYNALDEMFDDENYNEYVCNVDWSFPGYDRVETVKSQYQNTLFIEHPEHHDVCFELDNTWQICGCYRPHYHEMGTHYPASFLPELKRVLWVGGGDSMLLHEILKYNSKSLELAIGLELDQKVTRASFKYFGTQPHWDQHDKVQWWYGDAAKSLLMLPREYFGTFDLILVDLSETVMSNSVTKELDIMAALSLLLKPDGIYMKNEIYFDQLSKLFKYTVQLHVFDVPILCSQSFIFGSNSIDFMKQNLTNHGTKDNLVFKPIDELDYRYFEIHDFGMNPYPERHCNDAADAEEEIPTIQDRSPGILMVLEAENCQFKNLKAVDQVVKALSKALKKDGFTVVSTFDTAAKKNSDGSSMSTVVLREGYVIARVWPEHKYVAFDIHLWSSYSKMEVIKKSLLGAVGSSGPKSSSAFRIVAGGMFGVATWKQDTITRGPRLPQCEDSSNEVVERKVPMEDSLVRSVVKESLELLLEDNVLAVVVCAPENGPTSCSSSDVVSQHSSVRKVVTLWTCPDIAGGVEYQYNSNNLKYECEKQVLQTLQALEDKVGVLVLDPSAEYAMAQILHRIVSRSKYKRALLSDKILVLAPIVDSENETWRRAFVDQFRNIYHQEPVFRSAVLYNTTSSSMEMGTFLSGDYRFIEHVQQVTQALEQSNNLVGETRSFEAGQFPKVKDNPTLFALPSDYDQSGPFEQWTTQQPLGQQTVFQFEPKAVSRVTKETLRTSIENVLNKLDLVDSSDISEMKEFKDLGDGYILFCSLKNQGGSVVVLWDGRKNVTINLFTLVQSEELATQFAEEFERVETKMKLMLRDEMPRGYGRVVNFSKDVGERRTPSWAMSVVKDS